MSSLKLNATSPDASDQWERWEMQAFESPKLDQHHHEATAEPDLLLDAASILAEIQEAKQLAIQQGYDEGFAKGHAEGYTEGSAEGHATGYTEGFKEGHSKGLNEGHAEGAVKAQQETDRLAELVSATQSTLNHLHEDMGQALLSLAVKIASHVLYSNLQEQPERILDLIKHLLHIDPDGKNPLTLSVNPLDFELVSHYLRNNENTQNWRVIENSEITAGGCKARTALGDIDATLEARWRRTTSTLKLKHDPSKLLSELNTPEADSS